MPVHIRSGVGDLRLTLSNGDDVSTARWQRAPKRRTGIAIMMIASRDAFDVGDTLTCRRADDGRDAPLVRGGGR